MIFDIDLFGSRFEEPVLAFAVPIVSLIALLSLVLSPWLYRVIGVPGIFVMTGILVLSAWALGVLNSHRRFFLPYFAPVLWNAAIIVTAVVVMFYNYLRQESVLVDAAIWASLALTLISSGDYFVRLRKLINETQA